MNFSPATAVPNQQINTQFLDTSNRMEDLNLQMSDSLIRQAEENLKEQEVKRVNIPRKWDSGCASRETTYEKKGYNGQSQKSFEKTSNNHFQIEGLKKHQPELRKTETRIQYD